MFHPQPMWVYDPQTLRVLEVNEMAVASYGYSRQEFLNLTLEDIRPPGEEAAVRQTVLRLAQGRSPNGAWRHRRKDGSILWVDVSSNGINYQGRAARLVSLYDVTMYKAMELEREQLLSEAIERADYDALTGLCNHRAFHDRLKGIVERHIRHGDPVGVVLMDLNNFRFFNDVYGHTVGDDVLRQIARLLQGATASSGDLSALARFGGDEFAVLVQGNTVSEMEQVGERMRDVLTGVSYRPPGYEQDVPMTFSVGTAKLPDDGPGTLELLAAADFRLARDKFGGGAEDAEHLRDRLARSVDGFTMLDALVTAVDNKDRYTRRHSEDVMTYSLQIARELGLDERAQYQVQVAALLHDVGKIGVPDAILRKPGKLTDDEYQAVKQHPMMGAMMIGSVPGFEGALDATRHHHERWDGEGYPFGLCGEETPLVARLMAVADAYSAMTTDRPYRKGMSQERALQILEEGAGAQWDPHCVAVFVQARRRMLT
ncbi:bifunctional diguanylate cyclase/phosphohydrolase [Capsulimonas corticalis]|nr:HD domain-containing phosphohydrolase [Capsulimonas corticalis]